MHKDDEDTLPVPSSLLFARSSCSSFQSGQQRREREKEKKDGKEQAGEIWAYCTSFVRPILNRRSGKFLQREQKGKEGKKIEKGEKERENSEASPE